MSPAGIAPASFRLEVGCLISSSHEDKIGAPTGSCTLTTGLEDRHAKLLNITGAILEIGRAPRLRSGYILIPNQADFYLPRAR